MLGVWGLGRTRGQCWVCGWAFESFRSQNMEFHLPATEMTVCRKYEMHILRIYTGRKM